MLRGFGTTIDLERGTMRQWVVGADGIKRWADNGDPVDSTPSVHAIRPCAGNGQNEMTTPTAQGPGDVTVRPVAQVPVHPCSGRLWANVRAIDALTDMPSYPLDKLYDQAAIDALSDEIKKLIIIAQKLAQLAQHSDACSWCVPLSTGDGYWGCDCDLDSLVLDGELLHHNLVAR